MPLPQEEQGVPASPTTQFSHRADPAAGVLLPIPQSMQLVCKVTLVNLPLAQLRQLVLPFVALYSPGIHGKQNAPPERG